MYCTKCGAKLEEETVFCSSCGAGMESPKGTLKPKKKSNIFVAVLLFLIVVSFWGKELFKKEHEVIWNDGEFLCEKDGILYYTAYGEVGSISADGEIQEKLVTVEVYNTVVKNHSGVCTENLFAYEGFLYWTAYPGFDLNIMESEEEGGIFRVKTDGTGFEQLVSYPYPELGVTSMGVIDGELWFSVKGVNDCVCKIQFGEETDEYITIDGHALISSCGEITEVSRGDVIYADDNYLYSEEGRRSLDGGELEEIADCYEIPTTSFICDITGKEMAVVTMDGDLGYYLWDEGKWCVFDKVLKETYGIDSFILSDGKAYGICNTEERVVVFGEDWEIEKVIEGITGLVWGCDISEGNIFVLFRDEETKGAVIRVYKNSEDAFEVLDRQEEMAVAEEKQELLSENSEFGTEKEPLSVDASQGDVILSGTLEWRVGEFTDTGMKKQMYVLHLTPPVSQLIYNDPESEQAEMAEDIREIDLLLPDTVEEDDGRYDGCRVQVKGNIWPTYTAWYFNIFAMGVNEIIWEE